MDNNVDKLIKFCKEHKGDVFDVDVNGKIISCTLVGYNNRNNLSIVRLPKGRPEGWGNMVIDYNEDILIWKRYKIENYRYSYIRIDELEKKYGRTN